jgi:hypothetical protein
MLALKPQGPSLANVIAFTFLESPEDVARVERSAANRMAKVRGWYGWRVKAVDISETDDDLARITVHAEPVGAGYRPDPVEYIFITGGINGRVFPSHRFDAFLKACGVTERIDDERELRGRYFATRNRGRSAHDFAPLTHALVGC